MDIKEIEERCKSCQGCALGKTRKNVVIGRGSINAKLVFVGEAPGESEDEQGIPFVGAAGKLLDKYLTALDFPPDSYYICNILKCRPPHNRDPLPDEEAACMPFLREQIRLIKPQIIVCLGRISACMLIKPDFKITREHGKWFRKGNFDMCAVYHPSALLRDESKKEETYRDFEEIRKRI